MDETELRKAYRSLQTLPCPFEKVLLARLAGCECARRFNLAEREGVSCECRRAQPDCVALLEMLQERARFTLHQTETDKPLPHGKAIKLQAGAVKGLQRLLFSPGESDDTAENIRALVRGGLERFGELSVWPTDEIVRAIAAFQARRRKGG
ncbi:MAG: hypothetical protein Kow006_09110 [Gammaproteobacteria bacterium]